MDERTLSVGLVGDLSKEVEVKAMTEPKASRPNMPGYGILDADKGKGLLPWSWATERLSEARNYWVATTRSDGNPHAMPVWGVWLDDAFYFSTGNQSRKARNLAANSKCVICCELGEDQIVLEGEARLMENAELRLQFARTYQAKYNWDTEGFDEPFYAVRPTTVFGFSTAPGEFVATATRWVFDRE
jgi:nitroimidazol reductase NimA-like FMN-containing flavoprotein (pyridoxamine 5'-phosphate oxidase superfamily)